MYLNAVNELCTYVQRRIVGEIARSLSVALLAAGTFSDCAFATLPGANISISWANKILIVVSCTDLINAKVPASC